MSDEALLGRWTAARDAAAFRELAQRHGGLVYGTCRRILGEHQAAEDVAQECLLELARRAGSVRTSVAGFLHSVATSRARNRLRQDRARQRREQEAAARAGERDDGEATWAELAPLLDEAVAALPEDERLPILLHFFQGRSQDEIAAELGCGQASVSRRLERAIAALRARLKRAGVVASAIGLAALLGGNAQAAAPPTLVAASSKIALGALGTAASARALAAVKTAGWLAKAIAVVAALGAAGAVAYVALRRPSPTLLARDFEDGRITPETVGAIAAGPARPGSARCLAGATLPDIGVVRAMLKDDAHGLFRYRDGAELSFLYFVDDRVDVLSVYLWDATRQASLGHLQLDGAALTRGRWSRASVRLDTFRAGGTRLAPGDLVSEITVQTGAVPGALFIDDVRVTTPAAP